MPPLDPHAHYQLRLVRRFDGMRIVTYPPLAQPKSLKDRDKTLDITAGTERGALQKARNYCRRGPKRKGELPGEFLGVVLVKHNSDSDKSIVVSRSFEVTKRPKREKGTTVWLYYVDADGQAFTVNPMSHHVVNLVA